MAQTQTQMQASWQYTALPEMEDAEFQSWASLLESRTGISLPLSRKTFLVTNLHMRMRELGVTDFQSYYVMVTNGSRGQIEWESLVDKLTVHETRFFRDTHSLDLIQEHYLQSLSEQHHDRPYTTHVWSVGCATGEEPYSIAMLMDHLFGSSFNLYYGVTASDVSRAALQTGRDAIYHVRRVKNVPPEIAEKYLSFVDEEHVQVVQELKHKVCFTYANLLDLKSLPLTDLDIIFCQNVLIYFNHEMRDRVLSQFVERLKPNGLLVLGAGEVFSWTHPKLKAIRHESTQAYLRLPDGGVN